MTFSLYVVSGYALKFQLVQVCNIDKNEHTKRVNHPRVYSKLYAMQYVHLGPDHNNGRTKYSILE